MGVVMSHVEKWHSFLQVIEELGQLGFWVEFSKDSDGLLKLKIHKKRVTG